MKKKTMQRRHEYRGEQLRALAFPLGGIGTGTVALCGDGGLRQWQIFNNIDHNAHVPQSFFAACLHEKDKPPKAYVLQSSDWYDSGFEPAPCVSDHLVPRESRRLLEQLPGVHDLKFVGKYPIAEMHYSFPDSPVDIVLRAYSPFIPLEPDDSGVPAIIFRFTARNNSERAVAVSLMMSQQNAVGWDAATEIDGNRHSSYGGNRNVVIHKSGYSAILMDNASLSQDDRRYGQLLIAMLDEPRSARARWESLEELWNDFSSDGLLKHSLDATFSPPGETINCALAWKGVIEPDDSRTADFLLVWHFPNRYVDWNQPTLERETDIAKSKLWLGNYYAARFASALEVAEYVRDRLEYFDDAVMRFQEAMFDSSLPAAIIDAVSSQISAVRSPTCFRAADGKFYAFEGCLGASTEMMGDHGGCCPLNCTHVLNYAMTTARLFPQLERSMRETEWLDQQHESGYLPHRVVAPPYLRRPWDKWIGGPPYPALDGLLGAVLKTYREFLAGAGKEWLAALWNHVRLAMEHVIGRYDRGDGIIIGPQPCTYDVEIEGPNSFIISLYLAALRAAEEMAKVVGDKAAQSMYRERFRLGKKAADELLWNGEYYVHKHDSSEEVQAYGIGCHCDQLFGQWWAHALGLGYLFPRPHVRSALSSIATYNWRDDFREHQQFPRKYLRDDEAGLLNCTWPKGGRPETPLLYSDEIWTGIEYEVAGSLLYEGMLDDALKIVEAVRRRQDGRLRSPWNEVECGDHYIRPMSSWILLEAASGFSYNDEEGVIRFGPRVRPEKFSSFFAAARGWGRYSQQVKGTSLTAGLSILWGEVRLREIHLACERGGNVTAKIGARVLPLTSRFSRSQIRIRFGEQITVKKDETLRITID